MVIDEHTKNYYQFKIVTQKSIKVDRYSLLPISGYHQKATGYHRNLAGYGKDFLN